MKRLYLVPLALILISGNCNHNTGGSSDTSPSSTAPAASVAAVGHPSGNATTTMTPPSAASKIIQVTLTPRSDDGVNFYCNNTHIYIYFLGPVGASQRVTIKAQADDGGVSPLPSTFIFTDDPGIVSTEPVIYVAPGQWGTPPAMITNTNLTGTTYNVNVSISAGMGPDGSTNYSRVISSPLPAGTNTTGMDITTYSDNAGHQAVVVVEDDGMTM